MTNRCFVITTLILSCIASIALSAPATIEEGVHGFPNDDPKEKFSFKKFSEDLGATSRATTPAVVTQYNTRTGWYYGESTRFNVPASTVITTKFTCPGSLIATGCTCGLTWCGDLMGSIISEPNECYCLWRAVERCEYRTHAYLRCE